jgi:hypothetical protein
MLPMSPTPAVKALFSVHQLRECAKTVTINRATGKSPKSDLARMPRKPMHATPKRKWGDSLLFDSKTQNNIAAAQRIASGASIIDVDC